ncbi:hypothetical protein H6G51_06885 [Limnothrix sp. FACHB-708]|uniref:hypothetical protein n=1 Tax=unclassified Limnothrix TaxID=2632864 RepID=UPI0016879B19|nr:MULTISPECIES: hypothetical protein [unclassified Limnothrix]MBD2552999.1 hypothetical protein [Limnothrix sp. FACHB-708]MBD2589189.1 hypothetical protein [Limnothrix sp. FACHB-406]
MRLYNNYTGLSLFILALVYLALSWVALLAVPRPPSLVEVAGVALLVAVALAALFTLKLPWPEFGRFSWFQTATKSFGGAILAAMGVVIVLSRLDITTDVMLLLAAEFLAKVELRVAGRSRWQSFWQMLAASAVGIGSAIGLAPWFLMSRVSE